MSSNGPNLRPFLNRLAGGGGRASPAPPSPTPTPGQDLVSIMSPEPANKASKPLSAYVSKSLAVDPETGCALRRRPQNSRR